MERTKQTIYLLDFELRWVKSSSFLLQGLLFVLDGVPLMNNSSLVLNRNSSPEPTVKCKITIHALTNLLLLMNISVNL